MSREPSALAEISSERVIASRRPTTRKRRSHFGLESIQTLRYKWINRAGIVVHPSGYATLDVGDGVEVKKHFAEIDVGLQKAA